MNPNLGAGSDFDKITGQRGFDPHFIFDSIFWVSPLRKIYSSENILNPELKGVDCLFLSFWLSLQNGPKDLSNFLHDCRR